MIQQSRFVKLFLLLVTFCTSVFLSPNITAQSIVSVNNVTGTASATIPVFNVAVGDISCPVALSYTASGLRVEDYDNKVGLGWRLMPEASVIRTVKGFPDDVEYQADASYSIIKGWLRSTNTAPQTIQTLSLANNGTSNCGNEITDANTIANNFPYTYDTEPDYFTVNAPGLNCSFVFDGTTSHTIKTIPYRDYKIEYTLDAYGMKIIAFTITNENGIKYYFDKKVQVDHSVDTYIAGILGEIDPSTIEVFRRDFMMYRNKYYSRNNPQGTPVSYASQWLLTKMVDTKGNKISYTYTDYNITNPTISKKYSNEGAEIIKPDGSGGYITKKLYETYRVSQQHRLASISTYSLGWEAGTGYTEVQFNWGGGNSSQDDRLMSITLPLQKKTFELIYTKWFAGSGAYWSGFGRSYLKGLKAYTTGTDCERVNTQFDFTYYDVNEANNTCYCTPVIAGSNPQQTVDTLLNAQDYWGYYNGNYLNANLNPKIYVYPDNAAVELYKVYPIPGYSGSSVTIPSSNNRDVNAHAIDGSLKSITYPTGAVTNLVYENNEFFDKDVNGNVLGGGIRIKTISNNDGLNTVDVTDYSYNDPVNTSITTGRAVSVPKFAIAFQNTNSYGNITDKVINSTYRTTYDLNDESKEILYGKVTVKKTGTGTGVGKSIYEYNTTGTFGSTALTDWQESLNFVARTNLSSPSPCTAIAPSFLSVNNNMLMYPFTTNANFDFERGMLTKVTHKNAAGNDVATEEYVYDRSHQNPSKIYGLKLDEIGLTMAAYGKYAVNTTVDNLLITKTSKLYNTNSANPVVSVENYEYTPKNSSLPYRLLKAVSKQNSNSLTSISKFKYAKEYAVTTGSASDEMNNAIYNFNTNNNNIVIETSQHINDGVEKTIGASLNTFKKFTVGDAYNAGITADAYLPYQTYKFVNHAGITSFVPSTISTSTPNTFTWDNTNYTNAPTVTEQYNTRGNIQLITDNSRIPKTVFTSPMVNSVKYGEFINARPENIGIENFDLVEVTPNITIGSGNTVISGGRYSTNCLSFQPNTYLCKTISRPATGKNLVISFWAKDAQANGSIYLCFSKFGCPGIACTSNPVIALTTGSQWKYYQAIVPWANLAVAAYTYYFSTSTSVKIDEVLIYPDNAGVTSYSFTTNTIGVNLLTAKTGNNGVGSTYEYDRAGRLWLVRDQFDNIVEMKKYKMANRYATQIPSINLGYSQHYSSSSAAVFTANLPAAYEFGDCDAPLISYKWNFGDGSAEVTTQGSQTGAGSVSHSYAVGTYQVTVTASSPGMTDVIAQTPAVTNTSPNPLPFDVYAPSTPPTCVPGGTPQICAAGIIQYTSAQQCILSYCSPMTAACNNTNFKLTSISGGSLDYVMSVTWEIAPFGTTNWNVWQPEISGTGGFQTNYTFHTIHTSSYIMRAKVKFCDYSIAYSNVMTVKNGD